MAHGDNGASFDKVGSGGRAIRQHWIPQRRDCATNGIPLG